MSIYYRMDKQTDNLNPEENKKKGCYPRVIKKGTIGLEQLSGLASSGTTFKSFEVEVVGKMLVEEIIDQLKNGYNVCLEGFGTFSLSAESRLVENENDIRAESIHVKKVVFKTSQRLMKELRNARFERAPKKTN